MNAAGAVYIKSISLQPAPVLDRITHTVLLDKADKKRLLPSR